MLQSESFRESKTFSYLINSWNNINLKPSVRAILQPSLRRKLDDLNYVSLDKGKKQDYCKYCYCWWNNCKYLVQVRSERGTRRHIFKLLKNGRKTSPKLLKFRKYLFQCHNRAYHKNKLVLKCLVCNKETIKPMSKSLVFKLREKDILPAKEDDHAQQLKKKKKKKKKDAYAGLNVDAILKSSNLGQAKLDTFQTCTQENKEKLKCNRKEENKTASSKKEVNNAATNPTLLTLKTKKNNKRKRKNKGKQ